MASRKNRTSKKENWNTYRNWFFAKDIDSTYEELKAKQVDITKPEKQIWGGIMSLVKDQDENSYGLTGDSKE